MTGLLENLPILWINLERSEDRKRYMEAEFEKYGITNTHRIQGCDGSQLETFAFYKDGLATGNHAETGCLCSHIKALEYFVRSDLGEYCIVAEDDVSFEYVQYWKRVFGNI